ncbi:CDP-diacylglycerol--serine O-phosphatidyltransferase [Paenibacillus sediminis]|uniref:CDP-diacylglycerol--serine O-phosphatidyltransferase n=1 Tax=Paenibacillus sediminis TaxID=664909 RepID=A0ABS4H810_9BACL|nr:CDP-diacylglycerol--serine O-phosphatidyltransferase [Paenibacillus sediminis]MBP1938407.1 CDP-diacylglycerol--serine O-phosphatidyltransferase [Paenibacillus sediminis]
MITKSIPNMFTLGNLFLGMIAIIMAIDGNYSFAAIMVIIAMLMDGLDGRVARALGVQSEFGKELDSLSDVISFGAAPAIIVYSAAFYNLNPAIAFAVTAIFPMCGALRLARFNVKSGIPGYFTGLPIPAAGGVLATLSLFYKDITEPYLVIATLLLSYLMISTVKYPNFKKVGIPKKAKWIAPIIIIAGVIVAVMFTQQVAKTIFVGLVLYTIYGMSQNVKKIAKVLRRHKSSEEEVYRTKN